MEYTDTNDALKKHLEQDDKITVDKLKELKNIKEIEKLKGEQPHTIFINFNGFRNILIKSRKPASIELAKRFNIDLLSKIQCKEAEVLNYVIQLCKIENIKFDLQFSCGNYSIDMYIHKYNLAIEIDENNHSDRDPEYEKNREEFIKNTLNCKFIRFDPDGKDCFISNLLLDILKIFKDHKKNLKKECFITNEKYNIDYVLNKVDEYINFYDDTPDEEFNLELAIIKEKTKQYSIRKEKKIRSLELEKEKTIKELQLKIELKKLEIEELKLRNNQNNNHIEINDNLIEEKEESEEEEESEEKEEKEESEYEQLSDANTTSSESEEDNELKPNTCLDCDTNIYRTSKRCNACNAKKRYYEKKSTRKVKRPSYEQLKTDLENLNYVQVGKKYSVSDNCIRKWIKIYKKYNN